MPTPNGFRITQQVPGGEPIDLTEQATSATWTSLTDGGFGSATISIPRILTQKERGILGMVTIEHEGRVLFEGSVEDAFLKGSKGSVSTDIQAFGLKRLLEANSIRRAWSLRTSLSPQQVSAIKGAGLTLDTNFDYIMGRYDTANPSVYGFHVTSSVNVPSGNAAQVGIVLPAGLTGARLMFDAVVNSPSTNFQLIVYSTADGATYTLNVQLASAGGFTSFPSQSVALTAGANEIRIAAAAVGGAAATGGAIAVSNIRVLGTPLTEDTDGGFYGSTILRDAISFAPGIYPGTIENGTELILAEIARINRTSILDVVNEIAPLYPREWGVWEGGRFDWITPDLASPGWMVPLESVTDWSIEQSIDSVAKRVYVTFQDVADQQLKEASADATSARNPYVRTGRNKDVVIPAPAAMTSITAPLLAAKLVNDLGRWPDIKGSVTLPALATIRHSNGSREIPALAIRAGDNITIRDLPVEDIYASGQDGQTVFHVTNVVASTDATVQLTLEGLTRRADVLLARLSR